MIATLSPSITATDETLSTLNYIANAGGIVNKPIAITYLTMGNESNNTIDQRNSINIKHHLLLFLGIDTQPT